MQGATGVIAVVSVIALAALAAAVFLGRSVARSGGPKTWVWVVLLAVMGVVTMFVGQAASVNYRMPLGWIVGLAVSVVILVGLFVRVGLDVKWQTGKIVALVGVLITANVALVAVMMVAPLGPLMVPLFQARAQQIGDAFGFEALLPSDEPMFTEYLPVDTLAKPVEGLAVQYEKFTLQESKAADPLSESDLREILAPGVDPLGVGGPPIPDDARYTVMEVRGNPALGVEYVLPPEKAIGGVGFETIHVLAFELDGVGVRMLARNGTEYQPDGSNEPYSALSLDSLAKIAETLEPIGR